MTKSREVDLRRMLEQRRSEIEGQVQSKIRGFRDTDNTEAQRLRTGLSDDPATEDIDFALVQMQSQTLEKIRAALARLVAGDYGLCDQCVEEIPETRLRALPFATRCRNCQETAERSEHRSRQRHANFRIRAVMETTGT
jgi:RNA polymerase-binding transcription factor